MANEMFNQLPQTSSATMSDIICAVQGYVSSSQPGLSVQETLQQVFNLFNTNMVLSNAGNPNGALAGQTYQLCWDSADKVMWLCTTTGASTSAVWSCVAGTLNNGQILIGSTGASPIAANITAGTGISVSNGPNSITIAATGAAGIAWTTVSGTSQSMSANGGYISNNASLVTLTLPATAGVGTSLYIQGLGAGGWSIAQNSGQNIQVGSLSTTSGAGGSLSSANRYDSINLTCIVANTTWAALGGPQSSGLTIV